MIFSKKKKMWHLKISATLKKLNQQHVNLSHTKAKLKLIFLNFLYLV